MESGDDVFIHGLFRNGIIFMVAPPGIVYKRSTYLVRPLSFLSPFRIYLLYIIVILSPPASVRVEIPKFSFQDTYLSIYTYSIPRDSRRPPSKKKERKKQNRGNKMYKGLSNIPRDPSIIAVFQVECFPMGGGKEKANENNRFVQLRGGGGMWKWTEGYSSK